MLLQGMGRNDCNLQEDQSQVVYYNFESSFDINLAFAAGWFKFAPQPTFDFNRWTLVAKFTDNSYGDLRDPAFGELLSHGLLSSLTDHLLPAKYIQDSYPSMPY